MRHSQSTIGCEPIFVLLMHLLEQNLTSATMKDAPSLSLPTKSCGRTPRHMMVTSHSSMIPSSQAYYCLLDKRYTCVHPSCLTYKLLVPTYYYPNWTSLQHHIHTDHPPTCPHASCNGKVFASHYGLRAHHKPCLDSHKFQY
jgi:hypothetical protein